MVEICRVQKIEGKTITVKGGELGGCFGCMNEECRVNGKIMTALNRQNFPLVEGSLVELRTETSVIAGQAMWVLLPPLLLFALAFAGVALFRPASSDASRAAAGVVGMGLGFLGIYWLRKLFPIVSMPEIVRVVTEEEFEAANTTVGSADSSGYSEEEAPADFN
jgi:positive regulator of sigma E activity